ncbi:SusC/RagA family TonB-linked outer membrane protein [Catalinimonas niigatensis]|uniref:SusC/RagA family TonB-linked outer membrane protein n=1 Tax=Catalinimonas niigatensis TaxID=1397264 RepID=UPI002666A1D6|nr:TonB-dependent receptor [Catalinimonas niigatensis]WPP49185.1 TonB-dependent receptor [Catalinimonas niigatensis]
MKIPLLKKAFNMSKFTFYGILLQCCTMTVLMASVDSMGQRQSINDIIVSLDVNDERLVDVFTHLEKLTEFKFAYNHRNLDEKQKVTFTAQEESLANILFMISKQTRLSFKRINENIHVLKHEKEKFKAVEEVLVDIMAITVTGKVTDYETGESLPGVNVLVKETSNGTITDIDGAYSITVDDEEASLVFSSIGYLSEEIAIQGRTTIDVVLSPDIQSLEEVVVVGYGTQRRSDLTAAVGSVSAKEIENEPVIQVGQALQGKVAGLQVSQNSGAPGSGLLIRVRGTGTVNNAEPLYVIDGNPNANPLDLVPDQIESIQVLKSASAAAIYGAQGANGVILITTKQGKAGASQLNVNFSQGWQQIQRNLPMTNAREYAILYNEGLVNAGDQPLYPDPDALGEGTDWQKEVFQIAPMTDVSVSASGGSESSRFYFSAGYINQDGIVKGSSFDRMNLRINSSHDINSSIRIGQNLSASLAKYEQITEFNFGSVLGNTLTANPEVPVRMPDGGWGYSETSLNSTNPLATINYTNNDTRRPVINGNVYADVTLLKDLVFRSQFNFNMGYSENTVFNPAYRISSRIFNEVADLAENTTRFREHSWANTLTYQKSVGNHNFDLLGGVTIQESFTQFISAFAAGLPENATINPSLRYLDLSTQGNRVEGDAGEWGILSFLGRVNYNYMGKYFTTVNFRADGSSRFGENNKFGYFPSFSLGWKISEEPFLQNVDWVNNLMLRGGWGSLGNQSSLPNYAFANLVTPNINYSFGWPQQVRRGQAPIGVGNPDLKWEATQETNLGFDFMGFEGKVTASFDWYYKKTTDMLLQVPVAQYSGIQESPFVNGGNVVNKGVEIMLGYENTSPGGFNYSISGNVAHNKNEVTQLSNDGSALFYRASFIGLVNITEVGSPIASFYGWKTDGLFQSQEEIDAHAVQSTGTAPGDIRFVDLNEDGVVNADDQTIIGNPWPQLTYGLNSSFSYKGFDLRLQFQGVYGNDILMALKFRTEGSNFFNYTQNVWDNRWTGPGTSNTVPRMTTNDPNNNMRSSEYYVEDGSYLRLRNIQLGYRIPQSVVNIRSFRIYASVQNALTLTKYPGFDPEIGTNRDDNPLYIGIDETNYPVPRIYTVGVNIGI